MEKYQLMRGKFLYENNGICYNQQEGIDLYLQ